MYILSADLPAHGLRDFVNEPLQPDVFLHRGVAGNLLAVFPRGDQRVAVSARIAVEEDDGPLVFVDDVREEPDVPVHHPAHEAGSCQEATMHGLHVGVVASEAFFYLCLAGLRGIQHPGIFEDDRYLLPGAFFRR
jgi:hypothetical protein